MQLLGLDIASIVELGQQIANTGALRGLECSDDAMFEYLVAVASLIYESRP